MAENFFPSRGCVYAVNTGNGGAGFYQLEGLKTGGSGASPVLITGADFDANDIVSPHAALNNKRILYVFGEDFGNVSVYGMLLLGQAAGEATAMRTLMSWFLNNKVSVKEGPVNLSVPGNKFAMYVHGIKLAGVDPEFNTQQFSIVGIRVPPSGS